MQKDRALFRFEQACWMSRRNGTRVTRSLSRGGSPIDRSILLASMMIDKCNLRRSWIYSRRWWLNRRVHADLSDAARGDWHANLSICLLRETCRVATRLRQIFWQRSKRVLLSPEFLSVPPRVRSHARMYPYFSCLAESAISCLADSLDQSLTSRRFH